MCLGCHTTSPSAAIIQAVFETAEDREFYLQLLAAHAMQSRARLLGHCLMTNHVHLIVVPEHEDSLARAFGRTHAEYAQAVNRVGASHRTSVAKSILLLPLDAPHVETALRYVDLNPVRAGLAVSAWKWPWSSAQAHSAAGAADPVRDPAWVEAVGGWDFDAWKQGRPRRRVDAEPASAQGYLFGGESG